MSPEYCEWCKNIPEIRDEYSDVLDKVEIYTGNPGDFPSYNVLGMISYPTGEICVRRDLIEKDEDLTVYFSVPIEYKLGNRVYRTIETVPVSIRLNKFVKTLHHELEHERDPLASEYEIDRRALDNYLKSYVRRNKGSIIEKIKRNINILTV